MFRSRTGFYPTFNVYPPLSWVLHVKEEQEGKEGNTRKGNFDSVITKLQIRPVRSEILPSQAISPAGLILFGTELAVSPRFVNVFTQIPNWDKITVNSTATVTITHEAAIEKRSCQFTGTLDE